MSNVLGPRPGDVLKEEKTCRICENIHGKWGMHYYVGGSNTSDSQVITDRYRFIPGDAGEEAREKLIRKARKMGFLRFWDGANGGILTEL